MEQVDSFLKQPGFTKSLLSRSVLTGKSDLINESVLINESELTNGSDLNNDSEIMNGAAFMNASNQAGESNISISIKSLIERLNRQNFNEIQKKLHINWLLRFMRFHQISTIETSNKEDVEKFLDYLASELNYNVKTQLTALKSLQFIFKEFLNLDLRDLQFARLKQRRGFFSRFGEHQCNQVIDNLSGTSQLIAKLACLCHLKLREVISIRMGDMNLKKSTIVIRDKNGQPKFIANIPVQLSLQLRIQSMKVKQQVQIEKETQDLHLGSNQSRDELDMLASLLDPEWQYLFPNLNAAAGSKHSSRLNQIPIEILQHNIRIAINRVNRFSSNSPVNISPFKSEITADPIDMPKHPSQKINHTRINNIKQTAFDFVDNRGAA